jgi:hypothetical protein
MQQISKAMIDQAINISGTEWSSVHAAAMKRRMVCPGLELEQFESLMKIECSKLMLHRGVFREWMVDDDNRETFMLMYAYVSGDRTFGGSLDKGIFLMGSLGSGKTIMLRGLTKVIGKLTDRLFQYISAYDLSKKVIANGTEPYSRAPYMIDDLGKENNVIKDYGTDCRPMVELFASRYDNGAITFVTTNYNMKTFADKYGDQTVERWLEMFNFIEMKSKSRRT